MFDSLIFPETPLLTGDELLKSVEEHYKEYPELKQVIIDVLAAPQFKDIQFSCTKFRDLGNLYFNESRPLKEGTYPTDTQIRDLAFKIYSEDLELKEVAYARMLEKSWQDELLVRKLACYIPIGLYCIHKLLNAVYRVFLGAP